MIVCVIFFIFLYQKYFFCYKKEESIIDFMDSSFKNI